MNPHRKRKPQRDIFISLHFLFLPLLLLNNPAGAQSAFRFYSPVSIDSLLRNTPPEYRLWDASENIHMESIPDSILLQKGDSCYSQGKTDSAILYFNILCRRFNEKKRLDSVDLPLKETYMEVQNRLGVIHLKSNNNILAFQYFLSALDLCNETKNKRYRTTILNNIAIMYAQYMDVEKAYSVFCQIFEDAIQEKDFYGASFILNNAVSCALDMNDPEKIKPWITKAQDSTLKEFPLSRFASGIGQSFLELNEGQYNTAKAAIHAIWKDIPLLEDSINGFSSAHFHLGRIFFEQQRYDSAVYHSEKSLQYAQLRGNENLIRDNFRLLADIYMKEGKKSSYIRMANQYIRLLDSTFANTQYLHIKDLEFSTINNRYQQKINALEDEQFFNGRIIKMKDRIIGISISVSIVFFLLLLYVYRQKKQEEQKNRLLFEKNAELLAIDKQNKTAYPLANPIGKSTSSNMDYSQKQELIVKIHQLMDESDLFLDPEFSLEKLSKELKSNTSYVSHAINETTGKNFASLVNEYRIKRACQYMSEPENRNYTLEYISSKVGFKSRNTFYVSFKKYIGLTPAQYLKISKEENRKKSDEHPSKYQG